MADVELRHLTTMAAIADEGTFGRAAVRLCYTQSSVSQQIAALEKAVGGAVFDRPGGPKPVRITPLGEVVLSHGRQLLAGAGAMATIRTARRAAGRLPGGAGVADPTRRRADGGVLADLRPGRVADSWREKTGLADCWCEMRQLCGAGRLGPSDL